MILDENSKMAAGKSKGRSKAEVSDWIANGSHGETSEVQNFRSLRFQPNVVSIPSHDAPADTMSSASSSTLVPEAPDGGYGWVIVLASFCIHFICDGISFSFGIMFPEIQDYFNARKTMSGAVGSVFLSIPLLSGPLAGALTDIYDCRRMTFVGGLIAAAGSFVSFFAFDIWQFMFTFAIVAGIGLSFCYNTAIVAVTYYFQTKRALATGIAVCGSGAGTVVFAPLVEFLFTRFGWRISLLFIGATLLLLVGCGFMIVDLEWPQDTLEYKRKKFIEKTEKERARNGLRSVGDESSIYNTDFTVPGVDPRRAVSLPEMPTFTRSCARKIEPSASIQSVRDSANEQQNESVARSHSLGTFLRSTPIPSRPLPPVAEHSIDADSKLPHLDLQVPCNTPNSASSSRLRRRVWSNISHSMDDAMDAISSGIVDISGNIVGKNFSCGTPSLGASTESNAGDEISSRLAAIPSDGQPNGTTVEENHAISKPICINATRCLEEGEDVERQPFLNSDFRSRKTNKAACNGRPAAGTSYPGSGVRMPRFSTLMGPLSTAQGRVPASNVLTVAWRLEEFGPGMSRRVPSAPAVFIRRKRKSRKLQIAKMIESWWEWLAVTKSLFFVPEFFTFLCSTFILYIFFDIPYVNFPEYAVEHLNVTETDASYLVSGIGLTNTLSMLFCGFLADWSATRKYILLLYGFFIFFAGLCVAVAPFAQSYAQLMVLCNGYGFFIGANYVLASVITVHILCLYDFQTGYGLLCLIEGLGNLIGPALVGFIHDNLSTYKNIFLVGGSGTLMSGLMVLLLELYYRLRSDSDKDSEEVQIMQADSTEQTFVLPNDSHSVHSNSSLKLNGGQAIALRDANAFFP